MTATPEGAVLIVASLVSCEPQRPLPGRPVDDDLTVAPTDWPSIAGGQDFDGDGAKDLFVGAVGEDMDGLLLHADLDDFEVDVLTPVRDQDHAWVGASVALGDGMTQVLDVAVAVSIGDSDPERDPGES